MSRKMRPGEANTLAITQFCTSDSKTTPTAKDDLHTKPTLSRPLAQNALWLIPLCLTQGLYMV
jgi:hypothetical protein